MPDGNEPDVPLSHDEAFRRFSRAQQAEGGIKAQSRRGKMAQTWWAARWLAVLESFDIGKRLDRGRSYARKGQVVEIKIAKGEVTSTVQGSRPQPYDVRINVSQISPNDWRRLAKLFAGKPIYSAKLLAGQMPANIEEAFAELGLSLFPSKESDLKTRCSCPDWSNPCKHVAAVYYLLGEEFDRDPFFIFRLRGLTDEELLALLDQEFGRGRRLRAVGDQESAESIDQLAAYEKSEPITGKHEQFWQMGAIPPDIAGNLRPPASAAPLLRRLGKFPFWRGEEDFWQAMDTIYRQSSETTAAIFGESGGETTKENPKQRTKKRLE